MVLKVNLDFNFLVLSTKDLTFISYQMILIEETSLIT